jgi:hypothetical protein
MRVIRAMNTSLVVIPWTDESKFNQYNLNEKYFQKEFKGKKGDNTFYYELVSTKNCKPYTGKVIQCPEYDSLLVGRFLKDLGCNWKENPVPSVIHSACMSAPKKDPCYKPPSLSEWTPPSEDKPQPDQRIPRGRKRTRAYQPPESESEDSWERDIVLQPLSPEGSHPGDATPILANSISESYDSDNPGPLVSTDRSLADSRLSEPSSGAENPDQWIDDEPVGLGLAEDTINLDQWVDNVPLGLDPTEAEIESWNFNENFNDFVENSMESEGEMDLNQKQNLFPTPEAAPPKRHESFAEYSLPPQVRESLEQTYPTGNWLITTPQPQSQPVRPPITKPLKMRSLDGPETPKTTGDSQYPLPSGGAVPKRGVAKRKRDKLPTFTVDHPPPVPTPRYKALPPVDTRMSTRSQILVKGPDGNVAWTPAADPYQELKRKELLYEQLIGPPSPLTTATSIQGSRLTSKDRRALSSKTSQTDQNKSMPASQLSRDLAPVKSNESDKTSRSSAHS